MRTPGYLAAALLLTAVAFVLGAPRSAPAEPTSYAMTPDVRITMPDGVQLDSDEYVPTTGCPCPTILVQTPYRKSGSVVSEGNTLFPSNGYAMIVVDVRGTGSSGGMWDSFGANEQQDSVTLVQSVAVPIWVGELPYSSPLPRNPLLPQQNSAPFDWMRGFIDIHGVVGVDRPAEYERLVREAVARYPAEPHAHAYLIALLAQQGQPIAAAAGAARAAIPKTADARVALAGSLAAFVTDFGRLTASGAQALLAEASSLVDEALKMKPGDEGAVRTRARIEQLHKR